MESWVYTLVLTAGHMILIQKIADIHIQTTQIKKKQPNSLKKLQFDRKIVEIFAQAKKIAPLPFCYNIFWSFLGFSSLNVEVC